MSRHVLLTGATGLLGRYLVRDLLLDSHRVAVLVRATKRETARQRIEGILQMWENELGYFLPRPVCLEGDVCQPDLGLSKQDQGWLAKSCSSFIHSAASLTFHGDESGEPWRTNLDGTRNVLDLCEKSGMRELHYVSTAYVCGLRQGIIRESELDRGQSFRNDYEQAKLQAELLVRNAENFDRVTVYRPAVIAGDSRTGYTNTYHGLYMYLKLMSVLVWNTEPGPDGVRDTPVRLNMTGDERRNIVPVDWVSRAICHLYNTPEAHGRTFHLAPDRPLTPREVIEAGYTYFNSRGVEFCGEVRSTHEPISEMDRDARNSMGIYREYDVSDPTFDTSNLKAFAGDLRCPEIDEAMLHRFWKYAEEDRWGKRRHFHPQWPFEVSEYLDQICPQEAADLFSDEPDRVVGLDVLGPGGGQWTLTFQEGRLRQIERGLPPAHTASLCLSSEEFSQLAAERPSRAIQQIDHHLKVHDARGATDETVLAALFGLRRDSSSDMSSKQGKYAQPTQRR